MFRIRSILIQGQVAFMVKVNASSRSPIKTDQNNIIVNESNTTNKSHCYFTFTFWATYDKTGFDSMTRVVYILPEVGRSVMPTIVCTVLSVEVLIWLVISGKMTVNYRYKFCILLPGLSSHI